MGWQWQALWTYLYGNRVAIGAGALAVMSAAIRTLPVPGTAFDAYAWFYDWSHQFFNIKNEREPQPPKPQPATGPLTASSSQIAGVGPETPSPSPKV